MNMDLFSTLYIMVRKIFPVSILFFLILLVCSCVKSINPDIERGSDYVYREGYPDVRLSALGFLNEKDEAVVEVTTDIGYASLVYETVDGQQVASVELGIRVVNAKSGEAENIFREFKIESEVENFTLRQESFKFTEEIVVTPGEYNIAVSVVDAATGREIIRQTEAYIPDPENPENNLTAVRLSGKDMDLINPEFIPVTTYDVSSNMDSLKFEFQVTNHDPDYPLTIQTQLKHFPTDQEPAKQLSARNPSPSTLEYKGIDYRDYHVIDENIRRLDQTGSVLIEVKFPIFEKGNYRFEVETKTQDNETLFKARDFSVKGKYFPTLITAKELAEPLIYLMDNDEYKNLMALNNPDSLKQAMDRFWLSHIGSMRKARDVINLFYERVETANFQFTNFKEGWKTDRGKIYILFGPPWYIDKMRNSLRWSYTFNTGDPLYNFIFTRFKSPNEFYPFEHYKLRRKSTYHNLEYRQKQLWLTGAIMERQL